MIDPGPRASLRWQVWPARERPRAAALTVLLILAVGVGASALGGHPAFGLVSLTILFGSLNPFFSPTSFSLGDEGIEAVRWPTRKQREWADINSCYVDGRGATLSPFKGKSVLEPYRAVRLLFDGNREAVVSELEARLPKEVRVVELVPTSPNSPGD